MSKPFPEPSIGSYNGTEPCGAATFFKMAVETYMDPAYTFESRGEDLADSLSIVENILKTDHIFTGFDYEHYQGFCTLIQFESPFLKDHAHPKIT